MAGSRFTRSACVITQIPSIESAGYIIYFHLCQSRSNSLKIFFILEKNILIIQ